MLATAAAVSASLLLAFSGTAIASHQPTAGFNLIDDADALVFGATPQDYAGYSVSGGGDFNGDGFSDVVIGSPRADRADASGADAGAAYVIFGPVMGALDLGQESNTGRLELVGRSAGDRTGYSVTAGPHDFDCDGLDDIVVGAPQQTNAGSGRAYVVYGGARGRIDLNAPGPGQVTEIVEEKPRDDAGWSVAFAGDPDDDGHDDVLVGAPRADTLDGPFDGKEYLIYSNCQRPATISLATLGEGLGHPGLEIERVGSNPRGEDFVGYSAAGVSDADGDGVDDIVVGAPFVGANEVGDPMFRAGAAYLVLGSRQRRTGTLNLKTDLAGNGVEVTGSSYKELAGTCVGPVGDVNNDGLGDFVVEALFNLASHYVIHGSPEPTNIDLGHVSEGWGFKTVTGAAAGEIQTGSCTSAPLGDLNGDGYDEFAVSGPFNSVGGHPTAGQAFVVSERGRLAGQTLQLRTGDTDWSFSLNGQANGSYAGFSLGGAGDVDGNGRSDLIVGAPGGTFRLSSAGTTGYAALASFDGPQLEYEPVTAKVGDELRAAPKTVRNHGSPTFALAPGSPSLPAGLSLDPASGEISGTVSGAQPQTPYTVTMADMIGSVDAKLVLTVNGDPELVGDPGAGDEQPDQAIPAQNGGGTSETNGALAQLTDLLISDKCVLLSANHRSRRHRPRHRGCKRSARLTFNLDRAATVDSRITVQRAGSRPRGDEASVCDPISARDARKLRKQGFRRAFWKSRARCAASVDVVRRVIAGAPGRNLVYIPATFGTSRMAPGRYRVVLRVENSGHVASVGLAVA